MAFFNRLPFEIRAQIWRSTVEPRTVEVRIISKRREWDLDFESKGPDQRLVSTTPVPGPLHVCREARNMGLYKQAFSEVGTARRYVWVNLDIDIISAGPWQLSYFKVIAPLVKRLQFRRKNSNFYWFNFESRQHWGFVNVEEVHIICGDKLEFWQEATQRLSVWPCGMENVFLHDLKDGRMMTAVALDKWLTEEGEAEQRDA
ncbi:hypothetical protein V495_02259 [Pseudogymnoascus sp. VKM F-4514 (FW-929)]|nr:hypothetical protein V495_02259 [Pseudogymnoascus sp. VKM F-4514 (FW-929)]KFY60306.1 hypothetical protein V497_03723 [Pseudogymnoascus sp. VKM F-4516 (FW-969)]